MYQAGLRLIAASDFPVALQFHWLFFDKLQVVAMTPNITLRKDVLYISIS